MTGCESGEKKYQRKIYLYLQKKCCICQCPLPSGVNEQEVCCCWRNKKKKKKKEIFSGKLKIVEKNTKTKKKIFPLLSVPHYYYYYYNLLSDGISSPLIAKKSQNIFGHLFRHFLWEKPRGAFFPPDCVRALILKNSRANLQKTYCNVKTTPTATTKYIYKTYCTCCMRTERTRERRRRKRMEKEESIEENISRPTKNLNP